MSGERRRILVVEDEPAFAEVLSELLIDEGYSVLQVRDGVTALNSMAGQKPLPDLIMCDVMLPVLRGDRVAAEVRRRFPTRRVPIILMSASADPRVELRDVEFLAKPFDADHLLSHIEELLEPGYRGALAAS